MSEILTDVQIARFQSLVSEEQEALDKFKMMMIQIKDGSFKLSFSKIYAFSQSPLHLVRYVCGKKDQTPAMKFGEIIHKRVLEGEKAFMKSYLVLPKKLNLVINNDGKSMARDENVIGKIEYNNVWLPKSLKEKKKICKLEDYELACQTAAMFDYESYSKEVLEKCEKVEKAFAFDFFYKGRKYMLTGRIDKMSIKNKTVMDLKKVQGSDMKRIDRVFTRERHVDMQLAIYLIFATGGAFMKKYKDWQAWVLCSDNEGVNPCAFENDTILSGFNKFLFELDMFEKCRVFDAWLEGYEFRRNGTYLII